MKRKRRKLLRKLIEDWKLCCAEKEPSIMAYELLFKMYERWKKPL